jgi:hypothetical protein
LTREVALADAGRADEQVGVREPAAHDRPAERGDQLLVAMDLSPGHGESVYVSPQRKQGWV